MNDENDQQNKEINELSVSSLNDSNEFKEEQNKKKPTEEDESFVLSDLNSNKQNTVSSFNSLKTNKSSSTINNNLENSYLIDEQKNFINNTSNIFSSKDSLDNKSDSPQTKSYIFSSFESLKHAANDMHFDYLIKDFMRLFNSNEEFKMLSIYTGIFILIGLLEFLLGLFLSEVNIIADSFFHNFKSLSFLITLFSILICKSSLFSSHNNNDFKRGRIELIAALTNCILLIIVAMYMALNSLHMLTDTPSDSKEHYENEQTLLSFFSNFMVVKILFGTFYLLSFSDYIVHPSLMIKIKLQRTYKEWKAFNKINSKQLSNASEEIKAYNSHSENLNILTVSILTDLISVLIMYIMLFMIGGHYERVYLIGCFLNLFSISVLVSPIFFSLITIFMQGKNSMFTGIYEDVAKKISLNESIKSFNIKWAMITQNEITCFVKAKINTITLDKEAFKQEIVEIGKNCGVNITPLLETILEIA